MRRLVPALALLLAICCVADASLGARLDVGPDQMLKLPSEAAKIAKDGDTVVIDPGTYFDCAVWSANRLTVSGGGGPVIITDKTCQGKGLFVISGNDTTVRLITFARARVADGNGAGIRLEGRNLRIDDSRFVNNQSGILAAGDPDSAITISNSEFLDNGSCQSGCAHALSVGRVQLLRVSNSRFSGTKLGHVIVSAAQRTELIGNTIEDGPDGTSSYLVDLPIGGTLLLDRNLLEKGPQTTNPRAAVMIGDGPAMRPFGEVIAIGNRFANQAPQASSFIVNWSNASPVLDRNEFVGNVGAVSSAGAWGHWARVAAGEMKSVLRSMAAALVKAIRGGLARIGVLPT